MTPTEYTTLPSSPSLSSQSPSLSLRLELGPSFLGWTSCLALPLANRSVTLELKQLISHLQLPPSVHCTPNRVFHLSLYRRRGYTSGFNHQLARVRQELKESGQRFGSVRGIGIAVKKIGSEYDDFRWLIPPGHGNNSNNPRNTRS